MEISLWRRMEREMVSKPEVRSKRMSVESKPESAAMKRSDFY